jgi:hypothetical protein
MSIYSIFVHIHSGLRWFVLIFILLAIIKSAINLSGKSSVDQKASIFNLLALIVMHLQLFFGLVLYFISNKVVFSASSMKDSLLRFFLVEHIALMIIAVILITLGYMKFKRAADFPKKNKVLLIYYLIALVVILAAIPWPFRGLGAGWF